VSGREVREVREVRKVRKVREVRKVRDAAVRLLLVQELTVILISDTN
jgi:hypothetical protein